MNNFQEDDHRRLFLAVFLAASLLIGWQALVEWPKRQHMAQVTAQQEQQQIEEKKQFTEHMVKPSDAEENPNLSRAERLTASPRLTVRSDKLHGSIALKGARFDDLTLAKYRETLEKDSPEVTLFSPNGDEQAYFAQIGWVATDGTTKVPDQHTLWQTDAKELSPGQTATLHWNNGAGVTFILAISLDQDYMFEVSQRVENKSGHAISVAPYGYLNRLYHEPKAQSAILHQGPLGVLDGALDEVNYKDLREKGNKTYEQATGWLGITDKYWQASFIPGNTPFKATFSHYEKNNNPRYQADYLGDSLNIAENASAESNVRLFAGAKELAVLDRYTKGDGTHTPVLLFDRSVDFGNLYFLTKPMFLTLEFFYKHIGNFGIAILLLTIVVKMLMYPVATKSYHAMARMRELQPEMQKIRDKYFDDRIRLQQETMALYKREKVNPASGCLPLLIQMPIFFSLYKVLFVSIEMRHAPFFGWIHDLSAPDPLNIFTLFGLIPWNPPALLHIGILPLLYCATMIVQMKQQPKPTDPVQARMMNYMPFILLIVFSGFAAGLVIYWTWSNTLTIIQQLVIAKRHKSTLAKRQKKAA